MGSALTTACSIINQRPLLLTSECSVDERSILTPAYLTCADIDLQHTSTHLDSSTWREFNTESSALTKRATMVQHRMNLFKKEFAIFLHKSMVSMGKHNKDYNSLHVGDIVMILDKKKPTLPVQSKGRYTLGIIEKEISPRSFRIRYAKRNPEDKHPLIIGKHRLDVCSVTISECERSTQGLSFIARGDEFQKVKEQDTYLDPIFGNITNSIVTSQETALQGKENLISANTSQLNATDELDPVHEQISTNQIVEEPDKKQVLKIQYVIKPS